MRAVLAVEGPERARQLDRGSGRRSAARRRARFAGARDALRQHDSGRPPAGDARRSRTRSAPAPLRALERAGDGRAREQGQFRTGRPRRELRLGRDALRRRLQSLLPRAVAKRSAAISSSFKATRRPASTRAPFSKAASPKSSSNTSAKKSTATASHRIRIRG